MTPPGADVMSLAARIAIKRGDRNEILPDFDEDGLLPAWVGDLTNAKHRFVSPYQISMATFVKKFVWDNERERLASNLKRYLNDLKATGLTIPFIWVGGSFVDQRPANDIDIIVFCYVPEKCETPDDLRALAGERPELFEKQAAKDAFRIDSNFIILSNPSERIVQLTAYWERVFSACKGRARSKGFVCVILDR